MRETRQSGSEGGVARKRHPYPYYLDQWVGRGVRTAPSVGGVVSGRLLCRRATAA
jgi:hypothetical protein